MIVRMVLDYAYFGACCWILMILELMLDCDDFRDDAGFTVNGVPCHMRSRTRNQRKTLFSPPKTPHPPKKNHGTPPPEEWH